MAGVVLAAFIGGMVAGAILAAAIAVLIIPIFWSPKAKPPVVEDWGTLEDLEPKEKP